MDLQSYKDVLHVKNDFSSWAGRHTPFIPALGKQMQTDLCELMTTLVNHTPARARQRGPVSKRGGCVCVHFSRSLKFFFLEIFFFLPEDTRLLGSGMVWFSM